MKKPFTKKFFCGQPASRLSGPIAAAFLASLAALLAHSAQAKDEEAVSFGQLRLSVKTQPKLALALQAGDGTILNLDALGLEWCTEDGCGKFTPEKKSVTKAAASVTYLLQDPRGISLELLLSEKRLAYRFRLTSPKPVRIVKEGGQMEIPGLRWSKGFSKECKPGHAPDCFHDSHEGLYVSPVEMDPKRIAFMPLLVQGTGRHLLIGEMNVRTHAGSYLRPLAADRFELVQPQLPKAAKYDHEWARVEYVYERHDYIAEYPAGSHTLPWRFFRVLDSDADLLVTSAVNDLADPPPAADLSWIEPGFGTEEWITGAKIDLPDLGFASGVNTATYKYYIDFVSRFGMRYVILDDGWSDGRDIYKRNPAVDVPALRDYAAARGVKLILWVQSRALRENLKEKVAYLKSLGAAALKIDFFDRDDQAMNAFQEEIFQETLRQKVMVIMHGVARPAGQTLTFPHVMTWEGGMGHEYNKWTGNVTPKQKLSELLIRNSTGPLDFEGACFRNLWPSEFRPDDPNPYSQGSRAHEIAFYALLDSKMQIMAGNLGDYVRSPGQTRFLTAIPVQWDEVRPLDTRLDSHAIALKRAGSLWYLAGFSAAESEVTQTIALGRQLPHGRYKITELSDCPAGSPAACAKLKTYTLRIGEGSALGIRMAANGGGFVARIEPIR